MKSVTIVFPHQLFANSPALQADRPVVVVDEQLFFTQYQFHKRKLAYHRATMEHYVQTLRKQGYEVVHVESPQSVDGERQNRHKASGDALKNEVACDVRRLKSWCLQRNIEEIHLCDPHDDWLSQRTVRLAREAQARLVEYESPMFLNSRDDIEKYFADKSRMFQTDFYIHQRKRMSLLVDERGKPSGGKWSWDADNRKKYPKGKQPPKIRFAKPSQATRDAQTYVDSHFTDNYGQLDGEFQLPVTPAQASRWLDQFLEERLAEFGDYEDAIQLQESILHHSLLTPMLNVGLIGPGEVVRRAIEFAEEHDIALNSVEGFVRQIVGWREFIRAVYLLKGSQQRTRNFWGHTRRLPSSFWQGSTGIVPVDAVICKVNQTAYCHHIERLMILGNFMLLCEFDPDDVYRWFMELFIDAYDWVMVPNVYGMSQFADGGVMSTKPYISGSNYVNKMSDAGRGDWQEIWDGLFWRFLHVHRDFFQQNPRMGMLLKNYDAMASTRRTSLSRSAERFLEELG